MPEFELFAGQRRLIEDTTKTEHAIIAGLGGGKTTAGPRWFYKRVLDNPNSKESIVVAPNYRLLKNRCLVEFGNFLTEAGLTQGRSGDFRINESSSDMKITFRTGQVIHFLSGAAPENIVSYSASHIWIDEPALMEEVVVQKVVERLRCPKANYRQILFTGTPEGLNWFYERFHPDKVPRVPNTKFSESDTRLILHGSSYDNRYLPESYFRALEEQYAWDKALYANYVLGEWISLSRNRFYFAFDNDLVGDFPPDPETKTLYLTFDNNPSYMTWAVIQPWEDKYLIVADNGGVARNTEEASEQFIEKFSPSVWGKHHVVLLGDSALRSKMPVGYERPYENIVRNLRPHYPGLTVGIPTSNPYIEQRSRCTNKLFAKKRLLVDRGAKKVLQSAQTVETHPIHGIKKPSGDQITHAMEAVDMAMIVLEPPKIERGYVGIK